MKGCSQPFYCVTQTQLSYEFSVIRLLKWIQSIVSAFHGLDVKAMCSGHYGDVDCRRAFAGYSAAVEMCLYKHTVVAAEEIFHHAFTAFMPE